MRDLCRTFTALVLLATALPAAAQYVPYSELRRNNPEIDEAVAVLPSSDLHGTLNRISALLRRAPIRDLPESPDPNFTSEDLPDDFVRNMKAALEDLQADLRAASEFFGIVHGEPIIDFGREKWILLQTVRLVAFDRNVSFHLNDRLFVCAPSHPVVGTPCPWIDNPDIIEGLDSVASLLQQFLDDSIAWMEQTHMGVYRGPNGFQMNSLDTGYRVDELIEFGIVHGEPIIDL